MYSIEQHIKLELRIVDIDEQVVEYDLEKEVLKNGTERWTGKTEENTGSDYFLQIDIDADRQIQIRKGYNILESEYEIRQKFVSIIADMEDEKLATEKDGFDVVKEEIAPIEDITDPYDPKKIRVDPKTFSIRELNEMIQQKEIDLSPDFQRGFVWTDITRKSRLIESLLLRIPLPVFYLSESTDGTYQVVDGVQRLTVLKSFMNNEFKLKNLEYIRDCEGCYYAVEGKGKKESIPIMYKRRIDSTMLSFNVIASEAPTQVKYDIFKRINTGGKALNKQEIRNCFANASTRKLLRDLASNDKFLLATRGSISSTRMADQDIILRFIAFYLQDHNYDKQKQYRGGMDSYLDNTVTILNEMQKTELNEIGDAFLQAMENAYTAFGDQAFRKAKFINKALFLGISRVFCDCTKVQIQGKKLEEKLSEILSNDLKFSNALSMGTNDVKNIQYVYQTIQEMIG